jgi:hypothetical protein
MSTASNSAIAGARADHQAAEPSEIDIDSFQDIGGRSINPTKLATLLGATFGVGAYEIHVRTAVEPPVLRCASRC